VDASRPDDRHPAHAARASIPAATAPPAASVRTAKKLVHLHPRPPAQRTVSIDRAHADVVPPLGGHCRTLAQASGELAAADLLSECDRAGARRSFCPPWPCVRALHRVPAFRDALPRILDPHQRRTELRLDRLVASDSRSFDPRRGAWPTVTLRVHCGTLRQASLTATDKAAR
jgi:hypothetical protein